MAILHISNVPEKYQWKMHFYLFRALDLFKIRGSNCTHKRCTLGKYVFCPELGALPAFFAYLLTYWMYHGGGQWRFLFRTASTLQSHGWEDCDNEKWLKTMMQKYFHPPTEVKRQIYMEVNDNNNNCQEIILPPTSQHATKHYRVEWGTIGTCLYWQTMSKHQHCQIFSKNLQIGGIQGWNLKLRVFVALSM